MFKETAKESFKGFPSTVPEWQTRDAIVPLNKMKVNEDRWLLTYPQPLSTSNQSSPESFGKANESHHTRIHTLFIYSSLGCP